MNPLQKFWRIKVHVPVENDLRPASLGRIDVNAEEHVRAVVAALGSVAGVGRIGKYDSVFELDSGWEGYRAKPGASPRYGSIGEKITLGTVAVTTYLDYQISSDILQQIVAAVKAVHPWEHPIIEFSECLLYVPNDRI